MVGSAYSKERLYAMNRHVRMNSAFVPTIPTLYTGCPKKVRTGGSNPISGSLCIIANRLIMVGRTFYYPTL